MQQSHAHKQLLYAGNFICAGPVAMEASKEPEQLLKADRV